MPGQARRYTLSLRLAKADVEWFRSGARDRGLPVSSFTRLVLAAGRECLGKGCDWHGKAVVRGEELAAALARIDDLEAERAAPVTGEYGPYDGPPRSHEHGGTVTEIFGPAQLRDFHDLDAPDEQDVDQAKLVHNARRRPAPAPPRPVTDQETPW